ncbi:hypothetical protein [Saccharomonospora iraqiensis]|uniref:hypothetical protein n=1 Tax=Saccharomonospora iraqiensis TaxID=52698 RepID=UPI00022E0E96|nr:hypothetical protein [Saccharomonospora iraqiensis]
MHASVRGAVLAVVLAAVGVPMSACNGGPDGANGPDGRTGVPPTDTVPPTGRTTGAPEVTVRGTVARGVEPNCLVLFTDRKEYLLLRAGPGLRPGTEVVVWGTPRPGMPTTCMQGTPLVVREVDRVGAGSTS